MGLPALFFSFPFLVAGLFHLLFYYVDLCGLVLHRVQIINFTFRITKKCLDIQVRIIICLRTNKLLLLSKFPIVFLQCSNGSNSLTSKIRQQTAFNLSLKEALAFTTITIEVIVMPFLFMHE